MADDEDVIFKNSPLYQHLTEVGFTDFHAEPLSYGNELPKLITNEHLKQNKDGNLANRNLKERATDGAINSPWGLVSRYILPSTVSEEISYYSFCVATIKSSGLLADDDLELLYRFEQCTDTEYNIHDVPVEFANNNKLTTVNNSVFFNLVTNKYTVRIVLLIAIILGLLLKYHSSELKIISYILLLILPISLVLLLYISYAKDKIYILKKNAALLVDYIRFTEKLLVLKRKIILFIQEKELVAHGHIIVNPAAPVTRIESQIKQCMMLRKCLYIEMNNCLGLLSNKIKDVLDSRFHSSDHGNLNWLQKELSRIEHQCLTENEENLQANEYSLTALKKTYATLGSRQSPLLCCIAVNLMSVITYLKQSHEKRDTSNQFYGLECLLGEVKKCFDNLNECYIFHKVEVPAHILDENQVHIPFNNTVYSSFTLALHSMTLHLQQACKTSIGMEEKLDKMITESAELPAYLDLDEINKQILCIGQEIEKLNVCYEESRSKLKEIAFTRSSDKPTVENVVGQKANENSNGREERIVQIFNLGEETEAVSDQIFEGETTADYEAETQCSSSLGREELWREEKLREEGRHLLKELKFVLATKDEQKMVAIPKVLLKRSGAAQSEGRVGNTAESEDIGLSELDNADNLSCSAFEPFQSKIEEQRCVDKEVACESDEEDNFNMVDNADFSKNLEQSSRGSHNAAAITSENSDVVYDPANERNVNTLAGPISHINPFASMVAAAAVARNRQFGAMEESFELDAETFSDESDAN